MSNLANQQSASDLTWHPGLWAAERWATGTGGQATREVVTFRGINERLSYALSSLRVGSGGLYSIESSAFLLVPSGSRFVVRTTKSLGVLSAPAGIHISLGVPIKITAIRHYLSLSITDLGRVLRVERPTVYSWISESSKPHHQNLDRIGRIYDLAKAWRSISPKPLGGLLREPLEGQSILEMLGREDLSETKIRGAFKQLAASRNSGETKFGVVSRIRRRQLSPFSKEQSQASFDHETSF